MGTGPLALDDVLHPVFEVDADTPIEGRIRLSKSAYLSLVAAVYSASPVTGNGTDATLSLGASGTMAYQGTPQEFTLDNVSPTFFGLGKSVLGDIPGPDSSIPSSPSCPLISEETEETGPVYEDENVFETCVWQAALGVSLNNPMLDGTNWHDSSVVWVSFSYTFEVSINEQHVCVPSGTDPGGGSSTPGETNVIGVLADDEDAPADGFTFFSLGDGKMRLWVTDKEAGTAGLVVESLNAL